MAEKDDNPRDPTDDQAKPAEPKHAPTEAERVEAAHEALVEAEAATEPLDEIRAAEKASHAAGGHGGRPPGASPQGASWGLPLVVIDQKWTKWETYLCAGVLILEIAALSLWVALKGLSTPPEGAKAGIVFRAITGSIVLGLAGYWGLKNQSRAIRRAGAIGGVVLGLVIAKAWARFAVDWSANLLNWYQQASTLTLLGGLRGVGTRLTLLLALLGGSLATAAGRHITIDLVTRFLKPKAKLPITVIGWLGASIVCFGASWGFLDHIAIEDFGAKAEATGGQKISTIFHGIGEDFWILRKQIGLDFKALPHVMKGESYADWLTGTEWNAWLDSAGFDERYGKDKVEALRIPDDSKHAPMIVIPERGEPRGTLTHTANLVFPIGLFIIAVRFVLLALLLMSGHRTIETEAHLELGTHREEHDTKEAAP